MGHNIMSHEVSLSIKVGESCLPQDSRKELFTLKFYVFWHHVEKLRVKLVWNISIQS